MGSCGRDIGSVRNESAFGDVISHVSNSKLAADRYSFNPEDSYNLTELEEYESNMVSETSTDRDVSMILNHSIDSQDDFLIDRKKSNNIKPFLYDSEDEEVDERGKANPTVYQQTTQVTR